MTITELMKDVTPGTLVKVRAPMFAKGRWFIPYYSVKTTKYTTWYGTGFDGAPDHWDDDWEGGWELYTDEAKPYPRLGAL